MDYAGQIKAARAYLDWRQEDLAEASGLSVAGIQKLERGESAPTSRTQAKLARSLEKAGVRITTNGLEFLDNPIFLIEGETPEATYLQVLQDVLTHLSARRDKRELLIFFADDRVSPPSVNAMYRTIRAAGISMRQIVEHGNTYLLGPVDEYRYVPSRYFINQVRLVYGDCIASVTSDEKKIAVRVDATAADIERNTADLLWNLLEQPTTSDADERF